MPNLKYSVEAVIYSRSLNENKSSLFLHNYNTNLEKNNIVTAINTKETSKHVSTTYINNKIFNTL